jgi:hypothetical protein
MPCLSCLTFSRWDARRVRLPGVRESIPHLPWMVLVLGGAIRVTFAYTGSGSGATRRTR